MIFLKRPLKFYPVKIVQVCEEFCTWKRGKKQSPGSVNLTLAILQAQCFHLFPTHLTLVLCTVFLLIPPGFHRVDGEKYKNYSVAALGWSIENPLSCIFACGCSVWASIPNDGHIPATNLMSPLLVEAGFHTQKMMKLAKQQQNSSSSYSETYAKQPCKI